MEELINRKIAFHIHTNASYDCNIDPEDLVDELYNSSFETVIITDHNAIDGAIRAKKYAEEKYGNKIMVIIGEEILTDIGDIIGFPLNTEIQIFDHNKVISEIKKQGGFVCIPHPYKSHNLLCIHDQDFIEKIDFVEIFNSRLNKKLNNLAVEYAKKFNKNTMIGTDAHILKEIENTSVKFNNNFQIIDSKITFTSKRNIRLSQLINYKRKKRWGLVIKYLLLSIINK